MIPGTHGKMLRVDLSSGEMEIRDIDDEIYRSYLGGYAVAEAIVSEAQPAGVDPMGEDNLLCFSAGLLTGTNVPFSGRFMVSTKSPVTGGVGESNGGGDLGPALKKSGVDLIAIRGRSDEPVMLSFLNGNAEIRDAKHLWGKDTVETDETVKAELGTKGVKVACIGQAGEKKSLISGIVNDRARIAARMGLGAVMGSKGLKAVALGGSQKVVPHDKAKLVEINKTFLKRYQQGKILDKLHLGRIAGPLGAISGWMLSKLGVTMRQHPVLIRSLMRVYGTAGFMNWSVQLGDTPLKNWKGNPWNDFSLKRSKRIADEKILALQERKYHCSHCPLGCGGELSVPEGFRALPGCHKPEYETLASLGALLLSDQIEPLLAMNDMANRAGVDTISLGGVLAYAAECVEQNVLSASDLDGIELKWGDGDGFVQLTEKIIKREGIGDVLADGVKAASARLGKGSDAWAVHAGGIELPMHDPRSDPGYGTTYVADAVPGKHTSAVTFAELLEIDKVWSDAKWAPFIYTKRTRQDPERVGAVTAHGNLMFHLTSCAGLCIFGGLTSGANWPVFDWVNAATGWNLSPEEFKSMALRIVNLRWGLNRREGVRLKDFGINARAIGIPPLKGGPSKGTKLDIDSYARSYFKVIGWDYDEGTIQPEKIEAMGLPESARLLCAAERQDDC